MMTEFRLIDEQRHPATEHGEHCLLAAGAGSGKTRVLVERYLNILEAGDWMPHLPGRILAITFTEKAALEMRGRILERLVERAGSAAGDARLRLHQLLREMEAAPISTIHGFCSRLLKEHAALAGLDPRFGVPGELDLAILRAEVLDELLVEQDSDLAELSAVFDLDRVAVALEKLRELRRSLGLDPEDLAGEAADELAAAQRRGVRELIGAGLITRQAELARALGDLVSHLEGGQHPQPASRAKLAEAMALLSSRDLDRIQPDLAAGLKNCMSRFQKQGKAIPDEGRLAAKHAAYEKLRAATGELAAAWIAADPVRPGSAESIALTAACLRLTGRFDRRLRERMRARAWLDFEDLQLEAVALLRDNAGLRESYHRHHDHVLVDEFQDTNRLQLELVRLLVPREMPAERSALFLVGDERQSIYAFRNADVAVFEAERERMRELGLARELSHNHRSHPDLLEFFNAFFPPDRFPPMESLREASGQARVLLQLNVQDRTEGVEAARLRSARELAACLVDARERGLAVGQGEHARPVDWGDMAILVRSGASVRPLVRALSEAGIPYDADAGREYFLRQELLDLEALVAALDDPFQPLSLARGLRGDLIGLSQVDLLVLIPPRSGRRDRGELLVRLEAAAAGKLAMSDEGRVATGRFLDLRRRFAGRLRRLPLRELIPALIEASDFDLRSAVDPRALKVLRNLRQLAEFLGEMESGRRLGLRDFLAGMERLREHSPRHQEAWVPEEGGSLLRILTIHGAKGLEFPLLALFDLDRELRAGRGAGDFATLMATLDGRTDALLGLKPRDPAEPEEEGRPDSVHAWIRAEAARRETEENLRLLYVAMTRAEDYLILAGGVKPPEGEDPREYFLDHSFNEDHDFLARVATFLAPGDREALCGMALVGERGRLQGPELGAAPLPEPPPVRQPDLDRLFHRPDQAAAELELPVTSLTLLGSCPLRWLLARRLELGTLFRPGGEPWVPAPRAELERSGTGGAAMGTALHVILERWDFRAPFDEAFAAACPAAMEPRLASEARELLAAFFAVKQPWLERLAEAPLLRREEPFVFRLEGVLLHGQTDLVCEWRGQRILMDWKSDRVAGRDAIERRLTHHRFQILLYALALAAAGRPVDQALLVFLRASDEGGFRQLRLEEFDLEWAATRARRMAELARRLSDLEVGESGESLMTRVPVFKDPPCADCPFRDGPCPRAYRDRARGRGEV
jgi:ATP-dependent helicase/nuclease subunit A